MADQQGMNNKNVIGGAGDGGQPPKADGQMSKADAGQPSKADDGQGSVTESPQPPTKMAKLDPESGKLDQDVEDEEEAEYEEYEVDEDEEMDEEEEKKQEPEVVKKPPPAQPATVAVKNRAAAAAVASANVLNAPVAPGVAGKAQGVAEKAPGVAGKAQGVAEKAPGVAGKAPGVAEKAQGVAAKNPINDDEEEEYDDEEEDEEADYEDDDDDEPDPMKDMIHELLNKATSLKQEGQQSKLSNETKLTSILPQASAPMMPANNNQAQALAPKALAPQAQAQAQAGTGVPLQQPAKDDQAINTAKRPFVGESAGTLPKTMLMMKSEPQPQRPQQQGQSGVQLSPMRHCSNKWDMTNLNDDDDDDDGQGGANKPTPTSGAVPAAAADSDDDDADRNADAGGGAGGDGGSEVVENPILRQKLDIHRAVMAEQNRSMYDPHDSESGEDQIGEIEVAFENHYLDSSDDENEYGIPKQLDRAIMDIQLVAASMGYFTEDDDSRSRSQPVRTISSLLPPDMRNRPRNPDGIIDFGTDSTRNFASEFVQGVMDKASAQASAGGGGQPPVIVAQPAPPSSLVTGLANLNVAASTGQQSGSIGSGSIGSGSIGFGSIGSRSIGSGSIGFGSIGSGSIGFGSIGSGSIGSGSIGSGSIGSGSNGDSKMDFNVASRKPWEMADVKREVSFWDKIKEDNKKKEEETKAQAAGQQVRDAEQRIFGNVGGFGGTGGTGGTGGVGGIGGFGGVGRVGGFGIVGGEDPYAIVPELLPNIQTTDLSKKYSIDLTHVDPRVFPTSAQTVAPSTGATVGGGHLIGPSSGSYYHQQQPQQQQQQDFPVDHNDQNDQTEPQDGTWQTVMKHIIIAFIIYLGFKFLFGMLV